MNELQVFKNAEFGSIRTLLINGEPYFVGKDVAEILGYERPTKAVSDHVDPEDIDAVPIQDSIGRVQNTPIINESGLYSLILSSKMPNARKFKRWVTAEVLPAIRKHGVLQLMRHLPIRIFLLMLLWSLRKNVKKSWHCSRPLLFRISRL